MSRRQGETILIGDEIEIVEGLKQGERIAISTKGGQELKEGTNIDVGN